MRKALSQLDLGVIRVDETMEANTYCYHESKLSKNEREFYQKRSTMEGLIKELDREVAEIRNVQYSFIDENYFGGEAIAKRQEHEKDMKKFLEDNQKIIQRSGYEAGPNEEVISRPKKTIKRTTKVLTIFVVVFSFSNNNLIFSSVQTCNVMNCSNNDIQPCTNKDCSGEIFFCPRSQLFQCTCDRNAILPSTYFA